MPSVGLLAAGVAHELNSPLTGILTFAHVLAKRMPDNSQEQQHPFDVVLVNLRMPELDGLAFSRQLKDFQPDTEVMVMTGFAEISTAVEAIKLGAFDYVPKPFNPEQLVIVVAKALETREMRAENRYLRSELQRSVYGSHVRQEGIV